MNLIYTKCLNNTIIPVSKMLNHEHIVRQNIFWFFRGGGGGGGVIHIINDFKPKLILPFSRITALWR